MRDDILLLDDVVDDNEVYHRPNRRPPKPSFTINPLGYVPPRRKIKCPSCRASLFLREPYGLMAYCLRCDGFFVKEPSFDSAL